MNGGQHGPVRASQNVERYRRLLESVTEESKRQTILNLLGEERQKQKDVSAFAELVRHRQGDE
jgi:hypothetical protein